MQRISIIQVQRHLIKESLSWNDEAQQAFENQNSYLGTPKLF